MKDKITSFQKSTICSSITAYSKQYKIEFPRNKKYNNNSSQLYPINTQPFILNVFNYLFLYN